MQKTLTFPAQSPPPPHLQHLDFFHLQYVPLLKICPGQFDTYYIIREHSNFTNQLLTSSIQPLQQNARCKLIDNAPVQRARKLFEGPNGLKGLIGKSPKCPVTPAPHAHTTT